MRIFGLAGGIALAVSGAMPAAAAARDACLSEAQMSALVTYALPSLLEGARNSCAATLPRESYLQRSGAGLIARYRSESAGRWPAARDAFQAMMGDDQPLSDILGDDATKLLLNSVITGMIGKEIKPKDCGVIDEAVSLIAPLPSDNLGRLVTLVLAKTDKGGRPGGGDKDNPFRLCPAGTTR